MIHDRETSDLIQPFTLRWLVLLLGVPLTYAIVRHHVVMGVEWAHFPLYVANKGCSLAAVFFIAASYLIHRTPRLYRDDPGKRLTVFKFCGSMGFSLAAAHTLMSLLLFSPHYYPALFSGTTFQEAGQLNLTGELTMAFGVLSLWCLAITAITSLPFMYDAIGAGRWHRGQVMGYIALTLAAGHVLVLGLSGWFEPEGWAGRLPPISLVAFVAATLPVLKRLVWIVTAKQPME